MLKFDIMNILIVDDEIRAVNALIKRVDWQEQGFAQPYAAYSARVLIPQNNSVFFLQRTRTMNS